jgi:hypothetical protein
MDVKGPGAARTVIRWDGTHLPEELKSLPPGEYRLEPQPADPALTPEEDQGLRKALDSLDAGQGKSLAQVFDELRRGRRS